LLDRAQRARFAGTRCVRALGRVRGALDTATPFTRRLLMNYTVLARRFRPQRFGEVVGQGAISQALRNAIATSRVAHAYLFTGARGVGKTSTARILAKSLNCPQARDGDPCNQCEICQRISAGSDVDVLEIDGASSRGIDEIRTLRANVNVRPMYARHKIYIIDEVHMLTREAFNALLKTLEEPPANVKFVFCTTEPQKVPETIRSRCQRFDFGTIEARQIRGRLEEIAAAEGVDVQGAALDLIARRAAGSMRDSQSLFDQLLAFGGKSITAGDVHRLLGTASDDRLIALADALIERDARRVLELLDEALEGGVALGELTDQLLGYLRDLMVLAAGAPAAELVSVSKESAPRLGQQAKALGMQTILAAMQLLAEAKSRMRGSTYSRVLAELALVRIATLENLDALDSLLAHLQAGNVVIPAATSLPARNAQRVTPATAPAGGASDPPIRSHKPELAAQGRPVATATPELATPGDGQSPAARQPATSPLSFTEENAALIWAQVVSQISDMTRNQLKNAKRVAISGPNQLVVTLPADYHWVKSRLDKSSELLVKLQMIARGVVGQPVQFRFELEAAGNPAPEKGLPTLQPDAPQVAPVDRDAFVQRALELFDASIQRVEPLPPVG
jgi:DNA polymerase-3 subunit gamma/tau